MSFVSDTWHVCWRGLMHFFRQKVRIVTMMIQPAIWLAVMGNVFKITGEIPGFPAPSYLDYMAPGIVVMTALMGGVWGGMSIVWDRRLGFLNKLLAAPISRSSIVLGKTLSSAVQSGFQSCIILGIALLLGVRCQTGVPGLILLILIAMLLCLAIAALSLSLGAMIKQHETLMAVVNFLTMPLMFTSNALMPLEFMPSWLRAIATWNPLTYTIAPMRTLMVTGWEWATILPNLAILAAFSLAMTGVATLLFRRTTV